MLPLAQKLGGTQLRLLTQGKSKMGFVFQQYAHLQYWWQSPELQLTVPQAWRQLAYAPEQAVPR